MNSIKSFLNQEFKIKEFFSPKVKTKDLAMFFRQLSIMFSANLKISDIFRILLNQKNNKLNPIIEDLLYKVENGYKLSDAIGSHNKIFNKYHVSILKSGELTGNLDEALEFLSEELENSYDLINKIKGALAYPIFILLTMFAVIIVIMVYVVPSMTQILSETGGELPLVTRIVIGISSFLIKNSVVLILLLIALGIFIYMYYNTDKGRLFFHNMILKIPVFGNILKKVYISKISRSLFVLIRSSVPIIESFKIASEIVGNKVYENIVMDVSDKIKNGNRISASFAIYEKEIPQIFIGMVSVGEKTGKLDYVLEKVSNFYTKEIKNITNSITTLIEPIIMVFLGIVVAIIVAAVLLPMYSLSSQM